MSNEELIEHSINWFKDIQEMSHKLTTGNVSHNSRAIEGFSGRCAEFLEKYKNDKSCQKEKN